MKKLLFTIILLTQVGCTQSVVNQPQPNSVLPQTNQTINTDVKIVPMKQLDFVLPIDNFISGQTKKKFGQYITPATSPVQPEKFTGYHTGVDIEVPQDETDVPVFALADGNVLFVGRVNGYGGVIIMQFIYQDQSYTALYGHIRLSSSSLKQGDQVMRGQQLAVLGSPNSAETDGERKHLHFAIHQGTALEYRGYVQKPAELSNWLDPNILFK
jgi:murein DD-endopeptidase MepM/ murein hydrolase activator NlpD